MNTITLTPGWHCIYQLSNKTILVPARQSVEGVKLTFNSALVGVLTAPTEAELLTAIAQL